jgi:hypothetical protein
MGRGSDSQLLGWSSANGLLSAQRHSQAVQGYSLFPRNPRKLNHRYTQWPIMHEMPAQACNSWDVFAGVPYKQDPAILGWELGIELFSPPCDNLTTPVCCAQRSVLSDHDCTSLDTMDPPPAAWTAEMASFLKALDPNHLVIDGGFPVPQPCGDSFACTQARSLRPLCRKLHPGKAPES